MEKYKNEFLSRYRFSKRAVQQLLVKLPLRENTDTRGCQLPPLLQLLVALWFYGAGTFQIVTGDFVNVSQPTVSRVVARRLSMMIAATLYPTLCKLLTATESPGVMQQFYAIAGFPGVTGCIDCPPVSIWSPGGDDDEVFRNRKGHFSINVQAITGPRLQFFDLVASWPGSTHDSRIFDSSNACAQYEDGSVPGVLLGDQGYACRAYMLTPLRDTGRPGSPEYKYNKAQIKTRNSIERSFGIWKRRFPRLRMMLQIKTETVPIVVTACAALHNLSRQMNEPCPDAADGHIGRNHNQPAPAAQNGQDARLNGFRTRARLIEQYFS